MKTLLLDIETAPNTAFVWGLWDQNISHDQMVQTSYILCWSAKWLGTRSMLFDSTHVSSVKAMLQRVHKLLAKADVVIHFNGLKFDIPVLNKEFLKHNMLPPAPYKQIDLYRVVRHSFRFESNKMDSLTDVLGLGRKTKHKGFGLWTDCMNDDELAWKRMERYNKQDVRLLEKLYRKLLPWITKHPNVVDDVLCCPKCGSMNKQRRGIQVAQLRSYQRWQCCKCGGWYRGNKVLTIDKGERGVNI